VEKVNIKVDTREHNQEMFDSFDILATKQGFEYERTFLEVGDVACGNIVIERKEANDYVSSIMDGRLREQAAKMSLNYQYKYVIVEGNPYKTKSSINAHAIIGKMTSLLIKHDIKLLFVETPEQFAFACYSIIKKHMDEGSFNPEEFKKLQYKVGKNDIITAMLYQIPNIGYDKAKAIAEMFEYSLPKLLNEVTKEKLMLIKGIGETMAERIDALLTN